MSKVIVDLCQIDCMLLNQDHATLQDLHLNKTISVAHADERNGKYSIPFKGCMSIIKTQAHYKSQTSNAQIILEMPKPQIIWERRVATVPLADIHRSSCNIFGQSIICNW